jgi:nucleoside-diphosphate-sugar epimerase
MKVLVTGGGGYIGTQLIGLFANAGHEVTCMDRFFFGRSSAPSSDRIRVLVDDIRWFDPPILDGFDAVVDLASLSNDPSGELDPKKTLEINYAGRVRVATLAKKHRVQRYLLASTCSIYGHGDDVSSEESALKPLTTYARASMLAEQDISKLADGKFSPTFLRQATVYGLSGRMRFDLAINGMVRSFYKQGRVRVMRDGAQWRPFVHVKDAARAFMMAIEAEADLVRGKVFNVGSDDQNYQIFNLAKTVADAIGLPFRYEWYGSPDTRNYRVSFRRIREKLRFKPRFGPADGAREIFSALKSGELDADDPRCITVEWYKKLLNSPALAKQVELGGRLL